jgi:hypothetical protein
LRSKQLETYRRLKEARDWFFTSIINNEGRADLGKQNTENHIDVRNAESEFQDAVTTTNILGGSLYRQELRLVVVSMDIQKDVVDYLELRTKLAKAQEASKPQIDRQLNDGGTQHQLFLIKKASYSNWKHNSRDHPRYIMISRDNFAAYDEAEVRSDAA